MLKQIIAFGFVIVATGSQANDRWPQEEYDKSYLQIESCFENKHAEQVSCVISGIQRCEADLETVLASKGLRSPGGAEVSTKEYCNYIGLERADEHLNVVYQLVSSNQTTQGLSRKGAVANVRAAQRLWIQYRDGMCSEDTITSWHKGGSGWGAVIAECKTRLSIQQAQNLEQYFY